MAIASKIPPKPGWIKPLLDPQSEFVQGLAFVLWINEPDGLVLESVSNVPLAKFGAGRRVQSLYGRGARIVGDGTSGWAGPVGFTPLVTSTKNGLGDFTILTVENPPAVATAGFHGIFQGDGTSGVQSNQNSTSAGAASSGRTGVDTFSGAALDFAVTATGQTDGNYHVKVITRSVNAAGTTATLRVYVDGVLPTQSTAGTAVHNILGGGSGQLAISDDGEGTATAFSIVFAAGWNRAFTAAEVQQISAQPWNVWQRPSRWILKAAGGTPLLLSASGFAGARGVATITNTAILQSRAFGGARALSSIVGTASLSARGEGAARAKPALTGIASLSARGLAGARARPTLTSVLALLGHGSAAARGSAALSSQLALFAAGRSNARGVASLVFPPPAQANPERTIPAPWLDRDLDFLGVGGRSLDAPYESRELATETAQSRMLDAPNEPRDLSPIGIPSREI